jgi:iron complex outermembrane receptor protein
MPGDRFPAVVAVAFALPTAVVFEPAYAQTVASATDQVSQVVITGTRVRNRSALETAVPVDVLSSDLFRDRGVPEISQALSDTLPSYNYPRPGLSDATDTVRPATLRGLSPDETLVLVNGKRRHSASLVNINGTIGRGASAVDLNTIPTAMVKTVEVLRDGASAQYGSDAIAGVIDVRLREDRDGGDGTISYGVHKTSYDIQTGQANQPGQLPAGAGWGVPPTISRSLSDGGILTMSAWKGLSLGSNGFLTIAAEFKNQAHTERGGYDVRQQYPKVNGAFDPRELTFNRFDAWYGEPKINQKTVFANMGYDLAGGAKLYGWASYQDRNALSAGFYRIASDTRNTISIYPDGFLPLEAPEVQDYSGAGGVTWTLGDWNMDSSLVYGLNKMDFTIENTLNRSLGAASKTVFDAGGFDYDQLVFNFSGVRGFDVGLATPLNVALGLEARRESYSIHAGEPDSYINGGELLPNGTPTASGSQVFPGFRPANVVDKSRTAVGAYADLETRITQQFLASAALREERYSDFGTDLTGKLALRYDFAQVFALRGSIQNGFRAPSLQQQYFATTSTNFIGGVPFDITTFPATNPIAVALGARPLTAEKSVNFSVGAVIRMEKLNITIDAYRIDITNRIVLSENLTQNNVRAYLTSLGFTGVGGGRFFINGVDTRTQGVDIAATYPFDLKVAGRVDVTLAGNLNSTDVTRVPETAPLAALNPSPSLFDRVNVLTLEKGDPKNKLIATANWSLGPWGATARATRYGNVLSPDTAATFATVAAGTPTNDVVLHAKTLVDLEGRYAFTSHLSLALGAENLFDQYPDSNPPAVNTTGTTNFSNYSPFGRSGRFIYGRLSYDL